MAHLFLGQLVSTFDEEFRILFAQSQPLLPEKMLAPMEDLGSQKWQHLSERTAMYREPRKFLPPDTGHLEERTRHSFDERMDVDWRLMSHKRQEAPQGPSDVYGRFSPQQPRMDQPYDQGPSRITMLDNPAFKRHSYAEGVQGRFSHPFLQEPENQGRQFHRGQQPYPAPIPGPEADYSGYDKFWNQDFNSADQYSEPVISQEIQPPDGFDPVLNYLSSTRNVDIDQSSDKLLPSADLPFSSPHHRRQSLGQPYACQRSPSPSNPTDQKQFSQEPNTDRKDPSVKRGLRSWRISSYLSACDNPEDEGLPMAPPQGPDPFEETSNPIQQTSTGVDLTFLKIPNVREFKVPAIPRASQMPSYIKSTVREKPKKVPEEPPAETKITPTPSESSSTAEVEEAEEVELKEPKPNPLLREESFRRKYNPATPRSSRLRSSLIFSSLDKQYAPQDTKTAQGQQDEESDKNEAEETTLPFISQVMGKRRSAAREPFEWTRYKKSNANDNSATETSKTDDGNSKADDKDPSKVEDSKKNSAVLEPPEAELPKPDLTAQPPKSVLSTSSYIDMNDPDARFMFFKELAAKRKAEKAAEAEKSKEKAAEAEKSKEKAAEAEKSKEKAAEAEKSKEKAAEAEKSKEKAEMNPTDLKNKTTVKKEEPGPKVSPEKMTSTSSSEGVSEKNVTADDAGKTVSAQESLEASDGTKKQDSLVENDPSTFQSCKKEQTGVSTDSKKKEPQISTPASSLLDSAETESEDSKLSKPAVPESSLSNPPTSTNAAPADVSSPAQGTDESQISSCDSTSKESSSLTPSSVEVSAALDSKPQIPESVQVSPAPLSKQPTGSEISSSHPSLQSTSSDPILSDSGAQIRPSSPTSICAPLSTPEESLCSDVTPEDSSSTPKTSLLSPKSDKPEELESVSSSPCETSQTVEETTAESTPSESVESVSLVTSSETPSEVDSANLESEISPDTCTAGVEPDTSSLTSTTDVASPEDVKSDKVPPSPGPASPKSALPNVSDLKSSTSSPDQSKTITLNLLPDTPSETCSPVKPDITAGGSESTSKASPQDAPTQAAPPSELNLTGSVTPTPVETPSPSSPLSETVGAVLSPEAEKAETNISSGSPTDTLSLPKQVATDSIDTAETSSPTEPTSEILTEPEPTPESVILESQPSEPPKPAEDSKLDQQREISKDSGSLPDPGEKKPENVEAKNKVNKSITQESVRSEKKTEQLSQNICSENTSTEAKQPKTSQSRYQSSTANVLASSNLRDDTKLLLEQISANSQSRSEATKEAPVTDDEKEDEADKNAKREKERGRLSRAQPKSTQEKEKVLERMQSMRKERKVYSRFEV